MYLPGARVRGAAIVLALAAIPLQAQQSWTTGDPAQWSEQDIKTLVTDSPWAKDANVTANGRSTPATHIVVRWDSAAPVIEACSRGGMERYLFSCTSKLLYLSGMAEKFAALAEHFYIVGISNYPKPPAQPPGAEPPQHSAAANALLARMGQRLQKSTVLRRKGKPEIAPDQVVVLPAGQQLVLFQAFPRTAGISVEDGEVSFELTDGPMEVKATFDLRKMLYQGRLTL